MTAAEEKPGPEDMPAPLGKRQATATDTAPDLFALALTNARLTLIVVFVCFGVLALGGFLSVSHALAGFVAISLVALIQSYTAEKTHKRKQARALSRQGAVRNQEGIGSIVLQQMPDAVVLLDGSGRIVFYNLAAEAFVGKKATGKHIQSALREPTLLEALERVRLGGAAESIELARSVPVERHFQVFVSPADAAGKVPNLTTGAAVLLVLHDMSEAKRVEQMRVDFIANASHELKTPLASLSGFIETLQGPAKDDAEAHERFLTIMAEQTLRMQRLIEDLLSLSRIELREHLPPKETVSLSTLTKDVLEAIEPITTRDNVEISVDLPDDLPAVRGDWDELHQVIQNLVDNAVKYGQAGGRVEISATALPTLARVEFSVRDYGPGIARQHIPRLTERFYRTDVATSRERGGTGLGLAIVKHILNRHDGELRVESTLGEGSTFKIRLPVAA